MTLTSAFGVAALYAAGCMGLNGQSTLSFSRRDVSSPFAIRMTSGDYNRDGRQDVALLNNTGGISIMLGRGDGGFEGPRDVTLGPAPATFVVSADVDLDGRLDLISTHMFASVVAVALGRGDGTFQPARSLTCTGPGGIVVADFNGDGKPDLAVANTTGLIPSQAGFTVSVLPGRGDGTFGDPVSSPVLGQRPDSLAAGDFNQDGRADLVVNAIASSPLASDVSILISKGDGAFQPPRAAPLSQGPHPWFVVADFNSDGRADIALRAGPPQIEMLLGNGDGSFQPSQGPAFDGNNFLAVDMNGDSVPDLAGTSFQYNVAIVLVGRGDGSFEDQQPFQVAPGPNQLIAGDFNDDRLTDLVTCHQGQATLTVLLSTHQCP